MNTFFSEFNLAASAWYWILYLLDLTLKGSLILATALLISKIRTKAPFQFHYLIIFLGLGSLAVLPVIARVCAPLYSSQLFSLHSFFRNPVANPAPFTLDLSGEWVHNLSWVIIGLLTLWFLGFILQLLKIILSVLKMRRLTQHACKMEAPSWNRRLKSICLERKIRRPIELRCSKHYPVPITCGFFHAVIILPKEAGEWTGDQQQVVLLHELSHIRRLDNLLQLIARSIAAVFWFNPLVWTAVGLLHHHREGACDDYVIYAGYKPSVYAGHLLDMIQSCRRPQSISASESRTRAVAIPGAAAKERLLNILDTSRVSRVLSPKGVTFSIIVGILFIMPFSTLNPVAAAEKILPRGRSVFCQPGPNNVNQIKATPSPTKHEKPPVPLIEPAKKE